MRDVVVNQLDEDIIPGLSNIWQVVHLIRSELNSTNFLYQFSSAMNLKFSFPLQVRLNVFVLDFGNCSVVDVLNG